MFSKKSSNIIFIKIHPVGARLVHTDRQMDLTKLIATFAMDVREIVLESVNCIYFTQKRDVDGLF